MNQTSFDVGQPVRIITGQYAGAEGIIESLMPVCDAVRIHTKSGTAYAFLEGMVRLDALKPPKPVIKKRR